MSEGMTFFDTAERYGASGASLIPASLAALGVPVEKDYLGGDTESRLGAWAAKEREHVVPRMYRTTASDSESGSDGEEDDDI